MLFGKKKNPDLSRQIDIILDQLERSREINQNLDNFTTSAISSTNAWKREYRNYMQKVAYNVY